jgi:cytoskeletal protein RodZ
MNKGIKIAVGVIALLGLLSLGFILFSRKAKPVATQNASTQQKTAPAVKNSTVTPVAGNNLPTSDATTPVSNNNLPVVDSTVPIVKAPVANPAVTTPAPAAKAAPAPASAVDRKALNKTQWTECKAKTFVKTTNLIWTVQITEGIPAKGGYAKGNLNGDATLPVHVIIKSDSAVTDKIKGMLVVGKNAFLRGNCTDVATDGAVVLQAF